MKCQICGHNESLLVYSGPIRDGGIGRYTDFDVPMHQCRACGAIWHEAVHSNLEQYYTSEAYRQELEHSSSEENFYRLHDGETLDKLRYTGTEIFRRKTVADLGCGAGAFLDMISGAAKTTIGIEPSQTYRNVLKGKGYETYAYAAEALEDFSGRVDVLTSFDVIEHVARPLSFLRDIHALLTPGGQAIIGTPTDAPVMRSLLGQVYEKALLFSTQHLWIFSQESLRQLAEQAGFQTVGFRYFQRYGLGNALSWLQHQQPKGKAHYDFISETMDGVWKQELEAKGLSDYIVLYAEK